MSPSGAYHQARDSYLAPPTKCSSLSGKHLAEPTRGFQNIYLFIFYSSLNNCLCFCPKILMYKGKMLLKWVHIFLLVSEEQSFWQTNTTVEWPRPHACYSTEPKELWKYTQILQGPENPDCVISYNAVFWKVGLSWVIPWYMPNANHCITIPVMKTEANLKTWFHEPLQIPQLHYDPRWWVHRDLYFP